MILVLIRLFNLYKKTSFLKVSMLNWKVKLNTIIDYLNNFSDSDVKRVRRAWSSYILQPVRRSHSGFPREPAETHGANGREGEREQN